MTPDKHVLTTSEYGAVVQEGQDKKKKYLLDFRSSYFPHEKQKFSGLSYLWRDEWEFSLIHILLMFGFKIFYFASHGMLCCLSHSGRENSDLIKC